MMTRSATSISRSWLMAGLTLLSSGCKLADGGATAHLPPGQFFSTLALEHNAINLSTVAPYDTVTIGVLAAMADGSSVPGEISYSVSNPAISITDGILKAESAVARAVLRIKLTHGNVTRTDSAIVSVASTPPDPLTDFGIRLLETDSAKAAVGAIKTLGLIRQSESGANLSGLQVSLRSSDTLVAKISQSGNDLNITSIRPGRVMLYASTFAFGSESKDSIVFTVGWPLQFRMPVVEAFRNETSIKILDFMHKDITIGVGGCVVWTNGSYDIDLDIKFDNTVDVAPPMTCEFQLILDRTIGGNIAPYRALPSVIWDGTEEGFEAFMRAFFSLYQARTFSKAGIYSYTSTLHGTQGVIRVCDELNDTTCAPQGLGAWY